MIVDGTKSGIQIKQMSEDGTGLARIATMNVIDRDGDVIKPGAFGEQIAKVLPAHNWGHIPLGKARVFEHGDEALGEFQLNMETQSGKEWHSALKFDLANGRPIQDWSFGFMVEKESFGEFEDQRVRFLEGLKVHEISPVVLGAGVNTATLTVKSNRNRRIPVPPHSSKASPAAWDGIANEERLNSGETLRRSGPLAYAWQDPDGDPERKASWRFIHHFVDDDGNPGDASTRAAMNGIAVLNGARGGTTIPEADRQSVWNHLARHLRDADIEPPELRSAEQCGIKLIDECSRRVVDWLTLLNNDARMIAEDIKRLRGEVDGRGQKLTGEKETAITDLRKGLDDLHVVTQGLVKAIEAGDASDAGKLYAKFVQSEGQINRLVRSR